MNTNSDSPHNGAADRCNRAWLRAYNKEIADYRRRDDDTLPRHQSRRRRLSTRHAAALRLPEHLRLHRLHRSCVDHSGRRSHVPRSVLSPSPKSPVTAGPFEPASQQILPSEQRSSKGGQALTQSPRGASPMTSGKYAAEPHANESGARTKGGQIENEKGLGIQLEEAPEHGKKVNVPRNWCKVHLTLFIINRNSSKVASRKQRYSEGKTAFLRAKSTFSRVFWPFFRPSHRPRSTAPTAPHSPSAWSHRRSSPSPAARRMTTLGELSRVPHPRRVFVFAPRVGTPHHSFVPHSRSVSRSASTCSSAASSSSATFHCRRIL